MVDILVQKRERRPRPKGSPVGDLARDALRAFVKPSEEEIWAEIDRVRERIGPVSRNSTANITPITTTTSLIGEPGCRPQLGGTMDAKGGTFRAR